MTFKSYWYLILKVIFLMLSASNRCLPVYFEKLEELISYCYCYFIANVFFEIKFVNASLLEQFFQLLQKVYWLTMQWSQMRKMTWQ